MLATLLTGHTERFLHVQDSNPSVQDWNEIFVESKPMLSHAG